MNIRRYMHPRMYLGQMRKPAAGITLLEIVLATGLFLLLLTAVGGMFTLYAGFQRQATQTATLVGEGQNFLDILERELRTAYGNTFSNPGGNASTLEFKNQNKQLVTLSLEAGRLRRTIPSVADDLLTPASVMFQELKFYVLAKPEVVGSGSDSYLRGPQGRVTVQASMCPPGVALGDSKCLVVQTTLTSRQYAAP